MPLPTATPLRFLRPLLPAALAAALAWPAQAQQPPAPRQPSPEEMRQIMQATMGAMVGVMGPMTEAVIEAQLNLLARPEAAERIATFKRQLFEALVKKGFSAEQALQIVLTTALPAASPSTK